MKLIKPAEISGKILSLLEESEQRCIIVSPYIRISRWYKLTNKLEELRKGGLSIEIYVRDDRENQATYADLKQLGLAFTAIPNLHAKLYLNENRGIVTSLNLLLSSELRSLEIACITETQAEHAMLVDYYHRYILPARREFSQRQMGLAPEKMEELLKRIQKDLERQEVRAWPFWKNGRLHINTGKGKYVFFIEWSFLKAHMQMQSPRRHTQIAHKTSAKLTRQMKDLCGMKAQIMQGPEKTGLQIVSQAQQRFKSPTIMNLHQAEARVLAGICIKSIATIEKLIARL